MLTTFRGGASKCTTSSPRWPPIPFAGSQRGRHPHEEGATTAAVNIATSVDVNLSLVVAAVVSVQLRRGNDGRDLVHKRMVANGVIENCWRKQKLRRTPSDAPAVNGAVVIAWWKPDLCRVPSAAPHAQQENLQGTAKVCECGGCGC